MFNSRIQLFENKKQIFQKITFKGIQKLFLKRLFRKVKHSSRISFLKFPPKYFTEEKFYSERKETEILENAEQTFQETFSDDFLNLMENVLNSDSGTNSIVSPQNNMVVSFEVCSIFVLRIVKNIETKVFVSVFMFFTTGSNTGR